MKIVVTGGAGALGALVVAQARARGHEVTSASRRTGVNLSTGEGLRPLAEADAIVHCASNPRDPRPVDIDGTRRLIDALGADTHLVYVSIVGVDITPFAYYHAKLAVEKQLAEASTLPSTVVRATQFHPFAASIARRLMRGPMAFTVGDLASQPVDIGWVASRLVDHATGDRPAGPVRAPDLAGPDVIRMPEMAAKLRAHAGQAAPRVLRLRAVGSAMKAFASGSILAGPAAELGGETFDDWLSTQP